MRIFITGIAGFLGSHLADRMLALGHKVCGCDNLIGGYLSNVDKEVEFSRADCNDLDTMKSLMKGCDIVYHCAAVAPQGYSLFAPVNITKNLVTASTSVFTAAIHAEVKRIVSCSSMSVYGENEIPFTEDMERRPTDPYSIGKVASDIMLKTLCDFYGNEWVVAIPHNIIGPRQKYDDPYRNVASIMINLMLQKRQPIIYGDGSQMRCFSYYADDIVVLEQLAFAEGVSGQFFNIGPDEEFVTINTLAETIADIVGFKLKPVYVQQRPKEVKLAYPSSQKIREWFGYETKYTLRQGLEEMVAWISKKGTKPFKYHLPLEIDNEMTPSTWKQRLL